MSKTHRRCGKASCHCVEDEGHPMWSVTFSRDGERRVEWIPKDWVEPLEVHILEAQEYLDALKELMAINLELLALTRGQRRRRKVRPVQKERRKGKKTINISRR